jgi:hypothetical protein
MAGIIIRDADISEIPGIMAMALTAFGDSGLSQALFPDPARRAVDWPALRLADAKALFADPGRHYIVAAGHRADGTEEIVGYAEWIAPGGPDPDATDEERKAKREERKRRAPASPDPVAMSAFSRTVRGVIKAALVSIGLPEDADNDMWGTEKSKSRRPPLKSLPVFSKRSLTKFL